jgi:hypothetical protein
VPEGNIRPFSWFAPSDSPAMQEFARRCAELDGKEYVPISARIAAVFDERMRQAMNTDMATCGPVDIDADGREVV